MEHDSKAFSFSETKKPNFHARNVYLRKSQMWINNYMLSWKSVFIILQSVAFRNTTSPYEFYARPLKVQNMKNLTSPAETANLGYVDDAAQLHEDAMIAANNDLVSFAEELNSFYGHPKNRRMIDADRVYVVHIDFL